MGNRLQSETDSPATEKYRKLINGKDFLVTTYPLRFIYDVMRLEVRSLITNTWFLLLVTVLPWMMGNRILQSSRTVKDNDLPSLP